MKPADAQAFIAARLTAAAALAGIPLMVERPDDATPTELAGQEKLFEGHLATKGLVLVVLQRQALIAASSSSRLALSVVVPVAVIENPEVNRVAPGLQKSVRATIDSVLAALICDQVTFEASPVINPELVEAALSVAYVQPVVRTTLSATGVITPPFQPPA